MTDPYRTPGLVETDEQRVERLRNTYYQLAISGTPADPVKRAEAMAQLENAQRAWMDAARPNLTNVTARLVQRACEAYAAMTPQQLAAYRSLFQPSTNGAGNGTP